MVFSRRAAFFGGEKVTDSDNVARDVLQQLEHGWNAANGESFARDFADDADFVDIRGAHHRGRQAIAGGHDGIFQSVYRGSTIRYELIRARQLSGDVILVHSTAALDVPAGPAAGRSRAIQTLVLTRAGDAWRIASFHNTVVAAPPG